MASLELVSKNYKKNSNTTLIPINIFSKNKVALFKSLQIKLG